VKNIFLLFAVVFLITGCAFFKQAAEDYKTGRDVPLAAGEISPAQKAAAISTTASAIPYVNMAAPVLMVGLPFVFTWLRGRRIRKESLPVNANPITGAFGKSLGVEAVVQNLANVAAGMFEVGPNGSALKRGWKTALLGGLGVFLAPEASHLISQVIPVLQSNPPEWLAHLFNGTALAVTIGGLGMAEKWLSKVEPIRANVIASPQP